MIMRLQVKLIKEIETREETEKLYNNFVNVIYESSSISNCWLRFVAINASFRQYEKAFEYRFNSDLLKNIINEYMDKNDRNIADTLRGNEWEKISLVSQVEKTAESNLFSSVKNAENFVGIQKFVLVKKAYRKYKRDFLKFN